jgi:hypothetical protein
MTSSGKARLASSYNLSVIKANTRNNDSETAPISSITFCDSLSQPVASSTFLKIAAITHCPDIGW